MAALVLLAGGGATAYYMYQNNEEEKKRKSNLPNRTQQDRIEKERLNNFSSFKQFYNDKIVLGNDEPKCDTLTKKGFCCKNTSKSNDKCSTWQNQFGGFKQENTDALGVGCLKADDLDLMNFVIDTNKKPIQISSENKFRLSSYSDHVGNLCNMCANSSCPLDMSKIKRIRASVTVSKECDEKHIQIMSLKQRNKKKIEKSWDPLVSCPSEQVFMSSISDFVSQVKEEDRFKNGLKNEIFRFDIDKENNKRYLVEYDINHDKKAIRAKSCVYDKNLPCKNEQTLISSMNPALPFYLFTSISSNTNAQENTNGVYNKCEIENVTDSNKKCMIQIEDVEIKPTNEIRFADEIFWNGQICSDFSYDLKDWNIKNNKK